MTNWHLSQWKQFRFAPTATSSKNDVDSAPAAPNESTIRDPDETPQQSEMQRLRQEMPDLYRIFPSRFQNSDEL